MRNPIRACLLALALLLALTPCLSACGGDTPAETTATATTAAPAESTSAEAPATDAPATDAPTTDAPATDAPATDAPETDAPETEAPETDIPDSEIVKAEPQTLSFATTLSVTESGSKATATHESGLSYTAAGYTAADEKGFTFSGTLTLSFDPAHTAEAFNRFLLGYTSTQPLHGRITYTEGGSARTDDFFLEAGTHTFACVIGSYLKGKTVTGLSTLTLEACNDKTATFALCALETQSYPVYGTDSDTYYLENARFKLGIRLGWGGGINYMEDLECPVSALKNLVNQADTGRLIQQSYYGTGGNSEYQPGTYNGSRWAYNPVQGGDVFQNHSRIIDIVVTESSVYVKSQPQDWSLNNQITPSYMENTYTVYSDRIQVDNRFVDFSNWTHRYAHQELPAFYTVSYLSRFTLYNGSKPWTGDTMSYRDDLGFWGDSQYYNDCTFLIKESNTETWCAWSHPKRDFGIGLYVPNVDSLLAGRHAYNGSPDSKNGACNYVAPVNTMILKSFEALEYSYLITTGSIEEIRATFAANKDFATNESLHKNHETRRVGDDTVAWNEKPYTELEQGGTEDTPAEPETPADYLALATPSNNSTVSFGENKEYMIFTATGGDPHVTILYNGAVSADSCSTLELTYRIPASNSPGNGVIDLFICAGPISNPAAEACARLHVEADGEWHTLTVDLTAYPFWTGDLHLLRFDFLDACKPGDVLHVKELNWK